MICDFEATNTSQIVNREALTSNADRSDGLCRVFAFKSDSVRRTWQHLSEYERATGWSVWRYCIKDVNMFLK